METILHTIEIAHEYNIPVIVNPAPYQTLPEAVLRESTYLTPNEIELESMRQDPLFAIRFRKRLS